MAHPTASLRDDVHIVRAIKFSLDTSTLFPVQGRWTDISEISELPTGFTL